MNIKARAQGTIEYLVIIAIVVVMSLVVVGLVMTQTNSSGAVTDTSSEIKNKVGVNGISLVDSVASLDENGLLVLKNMGSETITVTRITVDGVDHNFTNGQIVYGADKKFRLTDIVSCTEEKKVYSVKIYYTSSNGLSKTADFQNIAIDCTNSVPDSNSDVDEIVSFTCNDELTFYSGDGTLASPYGVCNWLQLDNVRNYLDANFILLDNIDSSSAGYDGLGNDWSPVGNCGEDNECEYGGDDSIFSGSFNGDNKTISDLIINLSGVDGVALFGYAVGATISNIGLVDVNVTGDLDYAAALVAYNSAGTITNCYSTGNVIGEYAVGGLVGSNEGDINNCYSLVAVTGLVSSVGGLVGGNFENITDSYSTGDVNGLGEYVGGLVGYNSGNIINSYSTGDVNGTALIGGLVGSMENGAVTDSYSLGNVLGSGTNVGGLIGFNWYGAITNSYSTGNIVGLDLVGGLIGDNQEANVINCYSTGDVSGNEYVGGLIGNNYDGGDITSSFATGNTIGIGFVGGLVGYMNHGEITNSYATGDVNGILDSSTGIGGLVGYSESGIINTSYSTGNIIGDYEVGGLVGWSDAGDISDSYSIGSVIGDTAVGGFVGYNEQGTTTNCYSTGNVEGVGVVAGFAGYNSADINNSFSTGSVIGDTAVGGFVGYTESDGAVYNSGWWSGAGPTNAIGDPEGDIDYAEADVSVFYGSTHNVYTSVEPQWDFSESGDWVARDNNYPILSWQ